MTLTRSITVVLLVLLAIIHYQLWLGKMGVMHNTELRSKLEEELTRNQEAQRQNDQMAAEVSDLKEGLEMVEERARTELGMIKPNEIFVQTTTATR